jgi:SMC interacting uncharacterized protein involved in chromosome segregation
MRGNSITRSTIGHKATNQSSSNVSSPPRTARSKDLINRTSILYSMGKDLKNQLDDRPKRFYVDQKTLEANIARIFNYLQANHFDRSLTKNTLKLPSIKMFNNILAFLLTRIDPRMESREMESDDFVNALQSMGCPVSLQKGIFKALGAPNTWNPLLCVLSWLCELAEEKENIESIAVTETESEGKDFDVEEMISNRLLQFYSNGDDLAIEGKIIEAFDSKIESFEREITFTNQATDNMQMRIKALTSGQQPVRDLESQKMSLEYEKDGLQLKCREVEDRIDELQNEKINYESKIEEVNIEISKSKEKLSQLEFNVSKQKVNQKEAADIKAQIKAASQSIEQANHSIKKNRDKYTEAEIALSHLNQRLIALTNSLKSNKLFTIDCGELPDADSIDLIEEMCTKLHDDFLQIVNTEIIASDKELFRLDQLNSQTRFQLNQLEKDCWERNNKLDQLRLKIEEIRKEEDKLKQATKEISKEYSKKLFETSSQMNELNARIQARDLKNQTLSNSIGMLKDEICIKETEVHQAKRRLLEEKAFLVEKLMAFKNRTVDFLNFRLQKNVKLLNDLADDE